VGGQRREPLPTRLEKNRKMKNITPVLKSARAGSDRGDQ